MVEQSSQQGGLTNNPILNEILRETPYETLVDLEDELISFKLGTTLFKSRIRGTIYCEYNANRVTEEKMKAFIIEYETGH